MLRKSLLSATLPLLVMWPISAPAQTTIPDFCATLTGAAGDGNKAIQCVAAQAKVIATLSQRLAALESAAPVPAIGEHENTRAIIAYYSDKGEKRCPAGWSPYEEAKDRFIIAAGGKHPFGEKGGEETVTLSGNQMPKHGHIMFTGSGAAGQNYPNKSQHVAVSANISSGGLANANFEYQIRPGSGVPTRGLTGDVGGNQPHNNMPPYIALYFCKKD